MRTTTRAITVLLAASAMLGVGGCYYDGYDHGGNYGYDRYAYGDAGEYGGYRYEGDDYRGDRWNDDGWDERDRAYFGGVGADELDPWLIHTREGREIVRMDFDGDDDGRIREETAWRANDWFRLYADSNRDMRLTDEEVRIALVQASR